MSEEHDGAEQRVADAGHQEDVLERRHLEAGVAEDEVEQEAIEEQRRGVQRRAENVMDVVDA